MSNLIIRETKFLEIIQIDDEIIEEEEEEEKIVEERPTRTKRTRSNRVNSPKKLIKQTKKLIKTSSSKEKHTNSLIYLLNQIKGSVKLNTEFEYTTFQLDLPNEHLKSILNDFCLRFKNSPTFSEYLIKETLKVLKHDYFQKIKENSMMKLKMLLCHLAEHEKLKNYPSNPFLEIRTEDEIDQLRDKLLNFYISFYRPERMKLILKSNLAIDKMEQLLNESFNSLEKTADLETNIELEKQLTNKSYENNLSIEKENPSIYFIKPHDRKPEIEDLLPIRQNLMFDLDKFEENNNLNQQLEEKLVEENGLDKIISNKISFDNNHLIFNYSSQKQSQSKNEIKFESDQIYFIFNIPYEMKFYPLTPMQFISSFICKDGPGTLVSLLRKYDYIDKVQAGNLADCNFSNNSLWNLFFIKINLTKKGTTKLMEIVKLLNAYLKMLTKLDNLDSLFKEYSKLMLFNYNFKEIRSKSVHDLFVTVKKMHQVPLKDTFVANRIPLVPSLDKNLKTVKNLMKNLDLKNSIIAVLTDETTFNSIELSSPLETYKGIDVKKLSIDKRLFEMIDLFKVDKFPKTNIFLKNLSKDLQVNVERKVYNEPEMISKKSNARLWYKKECSELISVTSANLLISHNKFRKNAKFASICDLILIISEMQMQELFFQLREAGFLYKIEFNRFGLNIEATGSDEIINVFKQILINFTNLATVEQLQKAKKTALKNYENALSNKFFVYLDIQNCLLFKNHYTVQDKMNKLDEVDSSDLTKMMNMIFNESKRDYLIQGNYSVKDANKFFNEIEQMFKYDDFSIEDTFDETYDNTNDNIVNSKLVAKKESTINQTYKVYRILESTKIDDKLSEQDMKENNSLSKESNLSSNEIFPIKSTEYYCQAKLEPDSPERVLNDITISPQNCSLELSFSNEQNSSFEAALKPIPDNRRRIMSTEVKNVPNRKLFTHNMNSKTMSFELSKIDRTSSNFSKSKTKSTSILSNVCTDITNINYNLSPLNNSNQSNNFSNLITKDSQIVGNLYFTFYQDEVQHCLLLRLLVELIKQHMNGFFTNEQNLRDNFFSADKFKNICTPEITFQDQVVIDGQIECVEFELTRDSKGFIFIVFDNYLLINTKSIDSLAESFLNTYMFFIVDELETHRFDSLIKVLSDELSKKPNWSKDVNLNWNEIVIGKCRFNSREQLKNALKNKVSHLNLGFF